MDHVTERFGVVTESFSHVTELFSHVTDKPATHARDSRVGIKFQENLPEASGHVIKILGDKAEPLSDNAGILEEMT